MSNPLVHPSPTKESDTNDSLNIFHRWSELPSELKIKILRYTSFHTVMRFMLLSKESYALASRTKLRIDYIQISEPERRGTLPYEGRVYISVFPILDHFAQLEANFALQFSPNANFGGSYVAQQIGPRETPSTKRLSYDEDYRFKAVQVLLQYAELFDLRAILVSMTSITPSTHELLQKQTMTSQVLTNYLELRTENRALVFDLVRLLPPRCTIVICPNGVVEPDIFLDSKFFDLDVVKLASDLRISVKSGLTDDQLVRLQANILRISSAYITSAGINRLILDWIAGKRKITDILVKTEKYLRSKEMFHGVAPANLDMIDESVEGGLQDPPFRFCLHSQFGNLSGFLGDHICSLSDLYQSAGLTLLPTFFSATVSHRRDSRVEMSLSSQ
ncbi:unnamed protein product [Cylicocyclus nassatus]|uniref:F-box domain-containing protein n=1 Tax=Cylicocyclus nassatus TaxID=53992 RepID=A0AA36DVD3_CYLNA|nr:unnamed protein product [Cylicocyclus nassatus]